MSIFAVLIDLQLSEVSTMAKSYAAGGPGQMSAVVVGREVRADSHPSMDNFEQA